MHLPIFEKLKVDNRDAKDYDHWFLGQGVEIERHFYDEGWINKVWSDMELMVEKGKTKAIGVSNYSVSKIETLLKICKIPPAMNQIEIHPENAQFDVVDWCKSHNIQVTAYSPLGSSDRPANFIKEGNPVPLKNPTIINLSKKYNKSPAQIILRWDIQRGIIPIPKSSNSERIKENINIFDFELSNEDMNDISKLDKHLRLFDGFHHTNNNEERDNIWK